MSAKKLTAAAVALIAVLGTRVVAEAEPLTIRVAGSSRRGIWRR
jgi:hypothetical protein